MTLERLAAAGLGSALVLASVLAQGEPVALGIDPAAVGDRSFSVRSPDVRGDLRLRAEMLADYAREPLVLTRADQTRARVVVDQLRLHALASLAVQYRFLFGIDVPLTLLERGDSEPNGLSTEPSAPVLGDLRLVGRARLLGPAGDGTHLAAELDVWLPTGSSESFSSDGSVRAGGFVIAGGVHDRFAWSIETGLATRPSSTLPGVLPVRVGSYWSAGASAKWLVDAGRTLELGPELAFQSVVADGAKLFDTRSSFAQLLLGARFRPAAGAWFAGAAAGPGFGEAAGAADYRVLFAVGWSRENEPPPPDRDEDGVPDASDACIDLPGARSSDPVMNGCPELPDDTDGDSIPDGYDACPKLPGEPSGDRRTHGCPKPVDTDRDGIADPEDACRTEPGVRSPDPAQHGCPAKPPAPPPPPARLDHDQIVITEQVQFETGTAVLRPDSSTVLRAVSEILTAHPEVEHVEVQGHTDDTGTPELNRRLGQERADAVVAWLTSNGVAASRLSAKGYGQDRPIADNASEAGRAQNRRVEFRIVRRAPPRGAAP